MKWEIALGFLLATLLPSRAACFDFDEGIIVPHAENIIAMSMPELEMAGDEVVQRSRVWVKSIRRRQRILPIVDAILKLPEEEVDIWKVSLTLARDADPYIDSAAYTGEFIEVVRQARAMTPPGATPDYHVRVLNTLLYKRLGIHYDKEDYNGKKLVNRYAYGVLKTKKGTCANMATFYIAVAQRLGYPIHAVAAPQHLFARYDDPRMRRKNIEPTGSGGYDSDRDYAFKLEIPWRGIQNEVYLHSMTHRELAAELIIDHAISYYSITLKDYPTAIALTERALAATPRSAEGWRSLGKLYWLWGKTEPAKNVAEMKKIKGRYFKQTAHELGVGKPLSEDYWKKPLPQREERGPNS